MPRTLVTAGNTREPIDRVRDWGNIFTGNTGFAIAKALVAHGPVDLLTSNALHRVEAVAAGINAIAFQTHADLSVQLDQLLSQYAYDAIFMTAAVSDYAPKRTYAVARRVVNADGTETWTVRDAQAGKVKSDHPAIAVLGERTDKIVDRFRHDWHHGGLLVKFKLEVGLAAEQLLEVAEKSRRQSGADYLVANTLEMVTGERAGAFLLFEGGQEWVPRGELAERCAKLVADHVAIKSPGGRSKE